MTDLQRLTAEEADDRLRRTLPRWRREGDDLVRIFRANGFRGAVMAAGAIAHLSEAAWHHPELRIRWGKVEVRLTTHDTKGLSERDFALAEMIEQVMGWRPYTDDGPLEGAPEDDKGLAYLIHD